ncbi:ATP-binding protein [Flavihumibacter profundi]|uniref:ATP-binding protein n=1 Tax=Flavihumibacter profundi TaxID=2716883 RepID=UPI001CC80CAA|nr:ATP-binding protein [Flavihumibacter profundi]MBZ5858348.1 nuclear transport factor 2 family protein [Flavihumibacter profundi]
MKLNADMESAVMEVYFAYWESYINGDVDKLASFLDDGYTQVGSAESEVFFNKKDAVNFVASTINQVAGNVNMRNRIIKTEPLDGLILINEQADLYFKMEGTWAFYAKFRASSILQNKEGGWKFIHQHSSMPDLRTLEGENIAIEKITAENLELKDAIKRRTIELDQKNRELELETALERVRAVAMGMRKGNDLLDICEVLFSELAKLGFSRLRNAMINIYDDAKESFMNYDYSPEQGKTVTLFSYNIHPIIQKQVYQLRSSPDAFSEIIIAGKELADFRAMRLNNGESDDPRFDNIDAITYYFYSTGTGAIGLSTFNNIAEENRIVLKRFRNVFDLAYRRYMDISQAVAQARESQIETALERVRSRSMGMQKSDELRDVIQVIYEQMVGLNINIDSAGFDLDFRETDDWNLWHADAYTPFPNKIHIPYFDHPFTNAIIEAKKKGVESLTFNHTIENRNKIFDQVFKYAPAKPEAKEALYNTTGLAESHVYLKNVWLYISNYAGIPYTDAENAILMRFGKVFEQTYTRFKDLEQAEEQALEAVKHASVDRVRAEIASMRSTSDLEKITPLIWNELTTLGVPFIRCGVFIMDEELQQVNTYLSNPDGEAIAAFHQPYNTTGEISELVKSWRKNEMYTQHWDEMMFIEFDKNLVQEGAITSGEKYLTENRPTDLYLHFLPFFQGMLYVGNIAALSVDELQLVQNLADAFSTAYARYEDFKKLEAAKQQVDKTLIDLKQAQSQLVQAEKMASLGELTAGIAHEIQNPLNFVNNFSEVNTELIAEMQNEMDKGNFDDAISIANDIAVNEQKINHHGKRADAIVKGMLQHSRSSSSTKEPANINALADEYLRLAYHGFRAKDKSFNSGMKTIFDESLGKINIIPQDIGRVMLNLINNAFYAVAERNKLANDNYEPTVSVSTRNLNHKMEVRIADNGKGIPQKLLDKIFQPFFTTKPTGQGTGLGLSLAYDIVKAHDGELKVETKEGEGTEFIIVLPIT